MTELGIFEDAVFAHAKWKYRLRRAIESGKSEWTVAEVCADDRCEFGEWLKQLPSTKKSSERYGHLNTLHSEFHKAASQVLELALSGKEDEAREAMSRGSRFLDISTELVLTLSEWSKSEAGQG